MRHAETGAVLDLLHSSAAATRWVTLCLRARCADNRVWLTVLLTQLGARARRRRRRCARWLRRHRACCTSQHCVAADGANALSVTGELATRYARARASMAGSHGGRRLCRGSSGLAAVLAALEREGDAEAAYASEFDQRFLALLRR